MEAAATDPPTHRPRWERGAPRSPVLSPLGRRLCEARVPGRRRRQSPRGRAGACDHPGTLRPASSCGGTSAHRVPVFRSGSEVVCVDLLALQNTGMFGLIFSFHPICSQASHSFRIMNFDWAGLCFPSHMTKFTRIVVFLWN